MIAPTLTAVSQWSNFYVIVGSAGGALTGLQFVVIALVAQAGRRSSNDAIDAFATPTIVHFVGALWIAAVLSAPWGSLFPAAILLGLTGAAGTVYAAIVIRRASSQKDYKPVFEDWLWHATLPVVAYASLLGAATVMESHERSALFVIAGVTVLLVFIGVHNAWDTVTYITVEQIGKGQEKSGGA